MGKRPAGGDAPRKRKRRSTFTRRKKRRDAPVEKVASSTSDVEKFEVEAILNKRLACGDNGLLLEYQVKWAGYGDADITWEPREWLDNCNKLLSGFEAKDLKHPSLNIGDLIIDHKSRRVKKEDSWDNKRFLYLGSKPDGDGYLARLSQVASSLKEKARGIGDTPCMQFLFVSQAEAKTFGLLSAREWKLMREMFKSHSGQALRPGTYAAYLAAFFQKDHELHEIGLLSDAESERVCLSLTLCEYIKKSKRANPPSIVGYQQECAGKGFLWQWI